MRTYRVTAALLVALVFLARSGPTIAQCELQEVSKLTASDAAADKRLGRSVSVSGDVAVVGAYGDDYCRDGVYCGSAYVYRFNGSTWVEEQKFTASDGSPNDYFGYSISVSGDVAVVGAPFKNCAVGSFCGSAYVYRFNGSTWVEEQKLTASDAATEDSFGLSVSVSADVAVVGAPGGDCGGGADCGSAYVYRFTGSTWVEEQKFTASDAAGSDFLGWSVSVDGNLVVLGARLDDCAAGTDCGSAYVYRFNGSDWIQEAKLTASDAALQDDFGQSVSVSGDVVVVGANRDDCAGGTDCGSAYVYRFNGSIWVEEQKLTASNAKAGDGHGGSVSISGNVAVVGSDLGAYCGTSCGATNVYRFNGSTWLLQAKLTRSDAAGSQGFGASVSVSGEMAVVGAYGDLCPAGVYGVYSCGSAYVFGLGSLPSPSDCNVNRIADVCDIDSGSSTDANANWIPDECDTDLPPFIIEQPVNQVVCEGETMTFDIHAGGMTPLMYQWRKDTVDLNGETADTLTLSGVTMADVGDYDVVVTNDLGATTSDPATLSIAPFSEFILAPAPDGVPRNRYIGVVPPSIPCAVAIRVRLISLQHPDPPNDPPFPPRDYSAYEFGPGCTDPSGCVRWVGAPGMHLEVQDIPTFGTFQAASLQCTPHYQDWSDVGFFSVTGAEIIPSSRYEVEVFSASCAGIEDACPDVSPPLQIATARWGDIAERRNPPSPAAQPDVIDITWLVNKLKAFPGAFSNTVVQLQPNVPNIDTDVNAVDISLCVNAVKGYAYPFNGPCPCPSLVTCNTTACTLYSDCTSLYGSGALCIKTCVGGPKEGERCISHQNCRVCEGGSADGRQCYSNSHCPGGICLTAPVCSSSGFCHDACGRCTP